MIIQDTYGAEDCLPWPAYSYLSDFHKRDFGLDVSSVLAFGNQHTKFVSAAHMAKHITPFTAAILFYGIFDETHIVSLDNGSGLVKSVGKTGQRRFCELAWTKGAIDYVTLVCVCCNGQ